MSDDYQHVNMVISMDLALEDFIYKLIVPSRKGYEYWGTYLSFFFIYEMNMGGDGCN